MKKSIISITAAALSLFLWSGSASAQIRPQFPKPGEAPAGSPVAVHGALKVDGGVIKDKDNKAVVLRGMSFDWSSDGPNGAYYNATVVGWLTHDWRVSVLRAAMTAHSGDDDNGECSGDPGYTDGGATANRTRVENVVKAAIERGIYVIIDWHMHNLTTSSQSNCANKGQNLTSAAATFFGEMAETYGAYPNVIYEPWNEPLGHSWTDISGYSNQVISAIRAKGANGVVVVGSPSWSSQPNGATGINDSRNNVAYTVHFYAAEHTTTSGHYSSMTSAVNGGKAVFATEWGTTAANGDGSLNEGESTKWIDQMESIKVGWVNWRVSHSPQTTAILSSSASAGPPWSLKRSGTYVREKIVGYNNAAYPNWSTKYPINVTVEPADGGTVEKKVGTAVKNGPYDYGESVSLTAVPASGYQFDHWEGDAAGGNASLSAYKITGMGLNIKAVFIVGSMIKNGYFTTNTDDWLGTSVTLAVEGGALKATVNGATAAVRQTGLSLKANTKYKLTFRAKAASGNVAVTPRITNNAGSTAYWEGEPITLTSAWQDKEFEICINTADANAQIRFQTNNQSGVVWNLDDVMLDEAGACQGTSVLPTTLSARRASWSVARVGGALQLRGPIDAGARVSLYDIRGKVVRSMAATDGLTLGAGIPAGSYIMVVKNSAGREVLRKRVMTAR